MLTETLPQNPSIDEMPPLVTTEEVYGATPDLSELTPEQLEGLKLVEEAGPKIGALLLEQAVELELVKSRNSELEQKVIDLTEYNAKLFGEARLDEKTGLPNVRDLKEWLDNQIETGSDNLWVGFIDMDGLKTMNDTFGHDLGDEAIQHLADVLQTRVGEIIDENTRSGIDAKPARVGGDEFLFSVNGASAERIKEISQKILEGIRSMGVTADGKLVDMSQVEVGAAPVAASIGFAKHKSGESADDTIKEADRNMYLAKRGDGTSRENAKGRGGFKNRVFIEGELAA